MEAQDYSIKLSVIIVNYNVKHFLEQCLHSVYNARTNFNLEVFVVDNNSLDGSCHLVREKFPNVKLIANKSNGGYSVANNQAIRLSAGEYILLLNPDTVIMEDTFEKIVSFMDEHRDAGGLGVKMIDGKGRFLPESKRGLPTPWVAFYKVFGLSALFPNSKKFGRYHLSYISPDEVHKVDVLCGAFMLLRREALNETGLLDEAFFMYGEDIDLSYRILQKGYHNYYYPETTIIHYKGESTRKGSINYVKMFYNAMLIFSNKHFSTGGFRFYALFIHLAIYFRAFLAIVKRIAAKILVPLLDMLLIFGGYLIITPLWEKIMFEPGYYPDNFLQLLVPVYILFWLMGIYFSGGYSKPVSLLRVGRGILWGTLAILIVYSLIDEDLRFSRALIMLGALWSLLLLPLHRVALSRLPVAGFDLDIERQKRVAIVGHSKEVERVKDLLHQTPVNPIVAGSISINDESADGEVLGNIAQLKEIIEVNRIEEIIFCAESLSSGGIIRTMLDLSALDVSYKIAPPESFSIIGSNSIHTAGDLYLVNVNAISKKTNRRNKRVLDLLVAGGIGLSLPVSIWFFKHKSALLQNVRRVALGQSTWIGYIPDSYSKEHLPQLPPGVLDQRLLFATDPPEKQKKQLNILYAKDYRVWNDAALIFRHWTKLDRLTHE